MKGKGKKSSGKELVNVYVLNFFKIHCQKYVVIFYKYKTVFSLLLLPFYFISEGGEGGRKKGTEENPQSKPTTIKSQEVFQASRGRPKKSHPTAPVCYLSSVYKRRERGRGQMPMAGKQFTLFINSCTATLNHRGSSDASLMLTASRGSKEKERQTHPSILRPHTLALSHYCVPTCTSGCVLTVGQLNTGGTLTSVSMSYCLPTWQKSSPVFTHSLANLTRCY